MRGTYEGLPPARSVEQAIVLAQRIIARDLERQRTAMQAEDVQPARSSYDRDRAA